MVNMTINHWILGDPMFRQTHPGYAIYAQHHQLNEAL